MKKKKAELKKIKKIKKRRSFTINMSSEAPLSFPGLLV
jgi:hypothetical protein